MLLTWTYARVLVTNYLSNTLLSIRNIFGILSQIDLVLIHHSIFGFNLTFVSLLQKLLAGNTSSSLDRRSRTIRILILITSKITEWHLSHGINLLWPLLIQISSIRELLLSVLTRGTTISTFCRSQSPIHVGLSHRWLSM